MHRTPARLALTLLALLLLAAPALGGRSREYYQRFASQHDVNELRGMAVRADPVIPEPGAFALFAVGAGLTGLALRRRRRR